VTEVDGKFNPKLKLIWNGKGVEARGPLEWDDKETSLTLHVAIMQDSFVATGRSGDDIPHGADEFVIAAAVEGSGTLKADRAIATGWALVHGEGVGMYEWSVPVTLEPDKTAGSLAGDLSPAGKAGAQR
jgi:hypothetical protein